jgi:probable rRNA maturation factor
VSVTPPRPMASETPQHRVAREQRRLERTAARALAAVGRTGATVEVAIVDDARIRELNARYRGIPRRTDVLAFPLETAVGAGGLVGQIVISADTAARQAKAVGVPLACELDLLVTHGVLHLVGYDDRDPVEADLMHRREREILGSRMPARLWRGLLPDADTERRRQVTTRPRKRTRAVRAPALPAQSCLGGGIGRGADGVAGPRSGPAPSEL